MTIHARSRLDLPTLQEGRSWHRRVNWPWAALIPLAGVALLGLGIWLTRTNYPGSALPFALCTAGLWILIRPAIHGFWFRSAVKKMPMFGQEIHWEIEEDSIAVTAGPNTSRTDIGTYFKIIATPGGILFYPQKNLFHWLPLSAFESRSDYEKATEMVSTSPRFSKLK
jgi:hypothetical protein